jgi:hypothetical protein
MERLQQIRSCSPLGNRSFSEEGWGGDKCGFFKNVGDNQRSLMPACAAALAELHLLALGQLSLLHQFG